MVPRLSARLRAAMTKDVVQVAVPTALVVGTVLNAINHGRTFVEAPRALEWGAVLLNYLVPYCVSSWSAAALKAR